MANFQPILYQPHKNLFLSDREQQYFLIFCEQMAPQLAGHFHSDLWDCLVLQACEVDASIRSAIIALAALHSTSEILQSAHHADLTHCIDAQQHHQFAIRQYSKSIQSMRKAALGGKQDLRTTLITCIVIVCFETFHGNHESAAKQAIIGLDLIESWALARAELDSQIPSIEDELIRAFERLDIQAMTFIDPRTAQRHRDLRGIGQNRVRNMPAKFESIDEARSYLELVMRRCMHFMASLLPRTYTSGLFKVDISLSIPDEEIEGRERHLHELRRWHAAFMPILHRARGTSGKSDFLRATLLELNYLACYFASAVIRTSSQRYPDTHRFLPIFEQMVAGAEAIMEYPSMQGKGGYVFEIQVVCHLYAVAWRCPERTLRRKAISLLLSRPRREGLWCAAMAGNLATWIMAIEDESYEGEFAPDNVRVTCVDVVEFNMESQKARVRCLVPSKDSQRWIPRETVLYW